MLEVFLGIDFATQSARAILIDSQAKIYSRVSCDFAAVMSGGDGRLTQDPQSWITAIDWLLTEILREAEQKNLTIAGMCISATSGTFVLTNHSGVEIAPAAMYNDGRASDPLSRAAKIITEEGQGQYLFAHTPEFVISHLTGAPLASIPADWSHALKTGVDLRTGSWNEAALSKSAEHLLTLPLVVAPGTKLGQTLIGGIPIYAGMTDGCTAQISVGNSSVGSAVSTLGTTLVIKVVGSKEISGRGFYSHLLPTSRWLVGAASNLGGISFEKYQTDIQEWDKKAAAYGPASFVTYPLIGTGERFPVANREMTTVATAESKDEVDQYRGILEGIAFAERLAYETLVASGAEVSGTIYTVGGGARSEVWSKIRATVMNKNIAIVENSGSDLGAAMIACAAHQGSDIARGLDLFKSAITQTIEPSADEVEAMEKKYQEFLSLISSFQFNENR
jgi:xylulokinase